VRFIHQTGVNDYEALARKFAESGMQGDVMPFIDDMPAAFSRADIVVGRAGAGAMAELAAAGKPSILVPLPTAADNHQLRNAEAFSKAGAAQLVLDSQMDGGRLFEEIGRWSAQPALLKRMGEQARKFAHPDAARKAAEITESVIGR
jgi:UDP-N-acetylglucosamine--N-acetylmuramyl-(pentapeptide) pyrophosphoryl-undecaprenol N-acetylglucosamine transferase